MHRLRFLRYAQALSLPCKGPFKQQGIAFSGIGLALRGLSIEMQQCIPLHNSAESKSRKLLSITYCPTTETEKAIYRTTRDIFGVQECQPRLWHEIIQIFAREDTAVPSADRVSVCVPPWIRVSVSTVGAN